MTTLNREDERKYSGYTMAYHTQQTKHKCVYSIYREQFAVWC